MGQANRRRDEPRAGNDGMVRRSFKSHQGADQARHKSGQAGSGLATINRGVSSGKQRELGASRGGLQNRPAKTTKTKGQQSDSFSQSGGNQKGFTAKQSKFARNRPIDAVYATKAMQWHRPGAKRALLADYFYIF
jgi:hypothetical protein